MYFLKSIFVIIPLLLSLKIFPQIVIKGRITDFKDDEVISYTPFNRFYNISLNPEIVNISETGTFILKENFDNGFICLFINNTPLYLAVNKGDRVELIFSNERILEDGISGVRFNGSNAEGHRLFNLLNEKPVKKYEKIYDLLKNDAEPSLFTKLNGVIDSYLLQFVSLLREKKISDSYYKQISTSIKVSLLTEFLKPFTRETNIRKRMRPGQLDSLIKRVFNYLPPLSQEVYSAINGNIYINSYLEYVYRKSNSSQELENKASSSEFFGKYVNLTNKYLQENIWGSQLFSLKRIFPQAIDISEYQAFKSAFPQSKYIPYLDSLYRETNSLTIDSAISFTDIGRIFFLDSAKVINSLRAINGQVYFVDVWATWCTPCKREFLHNKEVDSFLARRNIKHLYISIDDTSDKKAWMTDVLKYKLYGYHIFASDSLIDDIKVQLFNKKEDFAIPKYFLLNEVGEIPKKNLPRPSYNIFFRYMDELLRD